MKRTLALCFVSLLSVVSLAAVPLQASEQTASDLTLIEAAKHGDPAAVDAALSKGIDVNARQGDGATALHWAVHNDDRQTVATAAARGSRRQRRQ